MNIDEQFQKNYKLPKLKHVGLIIAILLIIFALSKSFYTIEEQEQAVLTTFGNATPVTDPGLHFKIPFIQQVTKVSTTSYGFSIGYDMETGEALETESVMITSDYNFVNVDFFIEYKFSDPVKALYASKEPVLILKNIALSCIRSVIGSYDVDSVLTNGKNEIQSVIRDMIMEKLALHNIGISLINITIQDSQPPTKEVMEAFKAVETAKQGKETAINNANKYRNEKLPAALAEVDKIIKDAEAKKEERINEANGQVARFNAMYEEYIKFPVVTKQRMFYETMEDVLPSLKIIIDGTDGVQKLLPLDSLVSIDSNTSDDASSLDKEENYYD
jgi:membrane protease subunit HflK